MSSRLQTQAEGYVLEVICWLIRQHGYGRVQREHSRRSKAHSPARNESSRAGFRSIADPCRPNHVKNIHGAAGG